MPINYRNVDPHKVAGDVMKQRALEWDERAYADETEIMRLEAIQKVDPASADIAEALMTARANAKISKGKARRAAGAAPLDVEEVIELRTTFLNRWLTDVEEKHAAQAALVAEGQRLLTLKGKDALESAEKKEVEQDLDQANIGIEMLEATHELVTRLLDNLAAHPDGSSNGKASLALLEL